jgi:fucose permease
LEFTFSVLYNPALVATKTSILLFYLTLSKTQKVFRWATFITLGVVVAAGFALTFANIFQCDPVWAEFVMDVPQDSHCSDIVSLYLSSAPINISTDLAILAIPLPILTKMRLPRKQKIILIITFSFGAFVAAIDVVRIAYLEDAFQVRFDKQDATATRVSIKDDFSWYASLSFMWSAVEVHVGIICACVPSLKPLVARIIPSMLRDTRNPQDISVMPQSHPSDRVFNAIDFGAGQVNQHQPLHTALNTPPLPSNLKESQNHDTESGSSAFTSHEHSNPGQQQVDRNTQEIDMLEFITTPDMTARPNQNHVPTTHTTTTTTTTTTHRPSQATNATNFGFYNIKSRKPLTKLSNRESIAPNSFVTILFFLWGCAYGFLNVLNSQFSAIANFTDGQTIGTHAAYYAGYLVGPLFPGRIVLIRAGFKATFITGLCIYAVGTLVFWPSAVLVSYGAFIVSNLIVGIGVSILEVGANPFVALCGPPEHSEARLNLSQGVQAIGTVVAPLLAQKVLFSGVTDAASLIDVQWTYLGIALFAVALAVVFLYLPINEASNEDFEEVAEKRRSVNSATLFGNIKVIHITLALGIFAQFCYVGGQEAASVDYQRYIFAIDTDLKETIDPFSWQTIGHAVFALGRFICAGLQFFIKPRKILSILMIGMVITSALCMTLTGRSAVTALTFYELFQSGVFPLIFAICLRGLGAQTKTGASLLTAAISGGAIFPVIMNPVASQHGERYAFCVVVAAAAAGLIFPVYLETVSKAKKQVDPVYPVRHHLPTIEDRTEENPSKESFKRRLSERVKSGFQRRSADGVKVEHVEGVNNPDHG